MNWFTKLFKSQSTDQSGRDILDAYDAFDVGKQLFKESMKSGTTPEVTKNKIEEALRYFDKAIEKGCDDSKVFSLRGSCLTDLGFYFDTLEDYDKAIQRHPRKGIADNFYIRSLNKKWIYDFEGSIADLKEAIRLSRIDNVDNAYWNRCYGEQGFGSATQKYEMDLGWLIEDCDTYRERMKSETFKRKYDELKANLKRREK